MELSYKTFTSVPTLAPTASRQYRGINKTRDTIMDYASALPLVYFVFALMLALAGAAEFAEAAVKGDAAKME